MKSVTARKSGRWGWNDEGEKEGGVTTRPREAQPIPGVLVALVGRVIDVFSTVTV